MKISREVLIEFEEDKTTYDFPFFRQPPSPAQIFSFERFCKKVTSQGVGGLLKEYQDHVRRYVNCTRVAFDQNKTKNRYQDVICADGTRVILENNGYIHANHVRGAPLYLPFILCQGPLPNTVTDFWKMVDVSKVTHIVMLCDTVELGQVKCEQYIPKKFGDELKLPGGYRVVIADSNGESEILVERTTVTTKLLLYSPNGSVRKIRHHHYRAWPDKATPIVGDIQPLLKILQKVRTNSSDSLTIVHCSAGIGRTGTLVAIEMCLHQLMGNPQKPLNLLDIAKRLRDQRAGSIQVELQYVMTAAAVLDYGRTNGFIKDNQCLLEIEKFLVEYERRSQAEENVGKQQQKAKPGPPPKGLVAPPSAIAAPKDQPPPVQMVAKDASMVAAAADAQSDENKEAVLPAMTAPEKSDIAPIQKQQPSVQTAEEKSDPPPPSASKPFCVPLMGKVGLAMPVKMAAPPAMMAAPRPTGNKLAMMAPVTKM